jgi:hypothetical protein
VPIKSFTGVIKCAKPGIRQDNEHQLKHLVHLWWRYFPVNSQSFGRSEGRRAGKRIQWPQSLRWNVENNLKSLAAALVSIDAPL